MCCLLKSFSLRHIVGQVLYNLIFLINVWQLSILVLLQIVIKNILLIIFHDSEYGAGISPNELNSPFKLLFIFSPLQIQICLIIQNIEVGQIIQKHKNLSVQILFFVWFCSLVSERYYIGVFLLRIEISYICVPFSLVKIPSFNLEAICVSLTLRVPPHDVESFEFARQRWIHPHSQSQVGEGCRGNQTHLGDAHRLSIMQKRLQYSSALLHVSPLRDSR